MELVPRPRKNQAGQAPVGLESWGLGYLGKSLSKLEKLQ
jgi:hypothetical protein